MRNIFNRGLPVLFSIIFGNGLIRAEELPSKGGITLFMGPSFSYFQGESSDNLDSFDGKRLNAQLNGFIGYTSKLNVRSNSIGVFATGGYTNKATFDELTLIQNNVPNNLERKDYNSFYQIEAGMLIKDILRLSTGIGRQNFSLGNDDGHFNYYSSTAGLLVNLGSIYWNLDANFNYGNDYSKTVIKISTGIMLRF
ncbi:MAG: hypothetical protein Q8909_18025 [Bacteroidota bacterium]|nr:hypothetical protein [Bacteroidota bacterium]